MAENDIQRRHAAALVSRAREEFVRRFGSELLPHCVASMAPGRVNLIGEHTDYNEGFVMPMALPLCTVVFGAPVQSRVAAICSLNISSETAEVEVNLDVPIVKGLPLWANYVRCILQQFRSRGTEIPGFRCVIASDVPLGGGLSSSAALEVSTYLFLETLSPNVMPMSGKEKALVCQAAEHEVGMPCGIMDQLVAVEAVRDHALLIDCRSLLCSAVPLSDHSVSVLIINSNVRHHLTGSEYPERRQACFQVAKTLGKSSLRDADLSELEVFWHLRKLMGDNFGSARKNEVSSSDFKRAQHVINEINRTVQAADALKAHNYSLFGHLMLESHWSLRDLFEVSCPELDQLVELCSSVTGVFGARMTGGGFGGCVVALVKSDSVQAVLDHVKVSYFGNPDFFVCRASGGARLIEADSKDII